MKAPIAAIMFFTRIPLWRVVKIDPEYFKRVVEWWPLAGLLTGGFMAAVWWAASLVMPQPLAIALAIAARMLLTGALHEDGLADFFDGMGGGRTRERILEIMKDSHIGTYGVLGLVMYMLVLWLCLCGLPAKLLPWIILAADPWAKCCTSQLINSLPYCRKESEAKSGAVYTPIGVGGTVGGLLCAVLPAFLIPLSLFWAYLGPVTVTILMILYLRYKIQGYTGDCCGATALLAELSFYLICVALMVS
ncbi:MAG: adenosylcobinamide-GDP ribazoletransferase [Bacteroidales bacterium]|nr:adenosylcobinamide-GDP ribazoletransferase [Bacteroidales bacterium]